MNKFCQAYIEAALWSSTDDNDVPLDDNYGIDDLTPEALAACEEDCRCFEHDNATLLTEATMMRHMYKDDRMGHDFWLTRNGHGCGFWDRGLEEIGEKLTQAAKIWGSVNLYVTDDGRIDIV